MLRVIVDWISVFNMALFIDSFRVVVVIKKLCLITGSGSRFPDFISYLDLFALLSSSIGMFRIAPEGRIADSLIDHTQLYFYFALR